MTDESSFWEMLIDKCEGWSTKIYFYDCMDCGEKNVSKSHARRRCDRCKTIWKRDYHRKYRESRRAMK